MAVKHTFLFKGGQHKTKTLTPQQAIREKCLECCAWNRAEVRECTIKNCVLYPFRTGRQVGDRA